MNFIMFSPFENNFKFLKKFSIDEIEVIFFAVYLAISRPLTSTTKLKWSITTSKIHKIEKSNERTNLREYQDIHVSDVLILICLNT